MRHKIRQTLARIEPWDEVERRAIADTLAWIDSGVEICRLQKPATPPKHLISYALVVDFENDALLLVDHRKSKLWLPAGGHLDPGESPAACAKRELQEELRIEWEPLSDTPFFLSIAETVEQPVVHTDVALWYLFWGECGQQFDYDQREFFGIKWFSMRSIPYSHTDRNMERAVQKLLAKSNKVYNTE